MKCIAAVDNNWAIGFKGKLLVSIPNDQKMFSRGECMRGEKERNFEFYCNNGDVWMKIDYRRDRADRIECKDPRSNKFFAARSIGECEDVQKRYNRPEPPRKHHKHRDFR